MKKSSRAVVGGCVQFTDGVHTVTINASDECVLESHWLGVKLTNDGRYARAYIKRHGGKSTALARAIMNPPIGLEVDHINGNPLDNRRENLRVCTRSENMRNRKKTTQKYRFKGVTYHASGNYDGSKGGNCGRWRAYTRVMGKRVWLGYHATEEDAALAYNAYASAAFGEFARLNDVRYSPESGPLTRIGAITS